MPTCLSKSTITINHKNLLTDNNSVPSFSISKKNHETSKSHGFNLSEFSKWLIENNQILSTKIKSLKNNQKTQKKLSKLEQTESYHQSQNCNIFEFCLPVGRKQICENEYCELSPNSLLLKRGTYYSSTICNNKNSLVFFLFLII